MVDISIYSCSCQEGIQLIQEKTQLSWPVNLPGLFLKGNQQFTSTSQLGGGFKDFLCFTPTWGDDLILTKIFQMG